MNFNDHIDQISERYRATVLGLKGVLGIALHSEAPLSQKTKKELINKLNKVASGAISDLRLLVREAIIDAVSLSYDIALNNDYAIDELSVEWETLTDAIEDAEKDLFDDLVSRVNKDVSQTIDFYNRFRLNVMARTLLGEVEQRHLIVSEREKMLSGTSYKFLDNTGKRYDSSYYVSKRVAHSMYVMQRRAMYYLLVSMKQNKAQIQNPMRPNDRKVIELIDYFNHEIELFNYNSRALLVKSLVT